MNRINKIKNHKGLCIIISSEIILLVFLLVKLCMPNISNEYNANSFKLQNGQYIEYNGVLYAEITEVEDNHYLDFLSLEQISLPAGTYEIYVDYEASEIGSMVTVDIEHDVSGFLEHADDQLITSNAILNSFSNEAAVKILLRQPTDYLKISVIYSGEGKLRINSIRVCANHHDELMGLVLLVIVSAITDGLWIWKIKRKELLAQDTKHTIMALTLIVFLSSFALFVPYLISDHDLTFHLLRIEGIKESILTGQLPAKIQPNWLNGNGYAVSVFYGDLFLYIPAFLRVIGFSIHFSYVVYALLVNIATCLISYFCFKGMVKNEKAALIGSAVYTLSLYRLINMYIRGAVGEYSAMTFLPIIVYGIWKVFTDDTESKSYKYNFIIPVIGYTGLLQTHIISCEIAGIFTIITCVILIKKVFNKKRFTVLALIVIFTAFINAGFLVPFVSYMGEPVNINLDTNYMNSIQGHGTFLPQLFQMFTSYSGFSNHRAEGINNEMPLTTGIAVVVGGIYYYYIYCMGKIEGRMKKTGIFYLVLGCIALFMSTIYFPWDSIQKLSGLFAKVITSFQYPWRFLTAATVFLAFVTVIALKYELENINMKIRWFSIAVTLIAIVQFSWLVSGILNEGGVIWAFEEENLSTDTLIGCEYMPENCKLQDHSTQFSYGSDNISYTEIERHDNIIKFTYNNPTNENGYVATSIVYYRGYAAVDTISKKVLRGYSNNGSLYIDIPSQSSGTFVIRFVQPWYWTMSYIVSFFCAAIFVLAMLRSRQNKQLT